MTTNLFCIFRRIPLEVFLGKDVLKICSNITGEHPGQSAIQIKLQDSFTEITLQHECSPVNLLHNFRTPFLRTLLEGCFCIFHICWVSTAVALVKNVLLLVTTGKALGCSLPNVFNKSLIKCGKIVSCLMKY